MIEEERLLFMDWKNKNKDNIDSVVITLLNYENGVDTKTCYDEVDWLIQKAFFAGLKAGRPKWHDVLKDPADLPKVNDQYWVCYEDSVNIGRKGHEMWVFINGKWEHTAKVIAWCEMPKYTEEVSE